jgi:preprotein translocase subunit SecD
MSTIMILMMATSVTSTTNPTPATETDPRQPAPVLQLSLAYAAPAPDRFRPESIGRAPQVFVEETPVISDPDIKNVTISSSDDALILHLELAEEAAAHLRAVTAEHVGDQMALLFESRILSTVVIRGPIGGHRMQVSVDRTDLPQEVSERIHARIDARWPAPR